MVKQWCCWSWLWGFIRPLSFTNHVLNQYSIWWYCHECLIIEQFDWQHFLCHNVFR
jgi:hypothetical protein